ncbi:hypothetical protein P43SY_010521 [Pythium insidiosum]|uniref:Protein kinase domain-containing protein n=1 Tax=Pythium insidiosum TaxID=114742 RepID=A0AAD5Q3P3_PYTIN|nr:hypothetical protein P43SY_010521 [Pythium insidiosum]
MDEGRNVDGYREMDTPTTSTTSNRLSSKVSINQRHIDYDFERETKSLFRIPMKDITIAEPLSHGSFGDVYLGFYNNDRVAIKRLSAHRRRHEKERTSFLLEAKLMATLRHDRIIQFIGVAWSDPTDVHVVTEFMDGGDLRTLLQSFDASGRPVGFDACKVQIALHVIEGLAYLHALQPAVLHRDLKSRNVLLSANKLDAKLIDFGVSRPRADSTMTTCVGTLRWMAPEVMVGGRYGESADVFSFGVVLSELDTHQIPYHAEYHSTTKANLFTQKWKHFSTSKRSIFAFGQGIAEGSDGNVVEGEQDEER